MLLLNFIVQTKPLRSNWYFNTSYVVIKHAEFKLQRLNKVHFNTSYVVIKHYKRELLEKVIFNFNTSYVVIKQKAEENRNERIKKFQYILCCY